jgi:hypothetical protein
MLRAAHWESSNFVHFVEMKKRAMGMEEEEEEEGRRRRVQV